jgi:hypothetical protein
LYRENWLCVWVEWKHQKSCHCWIVGGVYPHVKGEFEGEGNQTKSHGFHG